MNPIPRRSLLRSGLALAGAAGLTSASRSLPASAAAQDDSQDLAAIGKASRTRFAINVEMWWHELPLLERIRQTARHGFPAIEFWPWRGKDLDAIADLCGELSLEIAQFTAWGFRPRMNDPRHHDAFEREVHEACAAAHKLGAKRMTVVAGDDRPDASTAQMLEQVVVALRRVAPIAEAADVMLILEPMNGRVDHPEHCLYGSPDAVRICREVASTHVKINWDLYHMQISEGDLCGRLREGFDQLGYAQLADHPGRNQPGVGEIHYPRVLRELHELGYEGYVGAECWPKGDVTAAARALARAGQWT
jgi:hydroxypyruvate isomerase